MSRLQSGHLRFHQLPATNEEADNTGGPRRLTACQPWACFVTFGEYCLIHFSRKCYSTVKQQLQMQAGVSAFILSAMDTTFMIAYIVGRIISDRLGGAILTIGIFASGACALALVGVALWLDFIDVGLPYWWAILIPAICNVIWGILTVHLIADPADIGIAAEHHKLIGKAELVVTKETASEVGIYPEELETNTLGAIADEEGRSAGRSEPRAISNSVVAPHAIACGFFKFINYVFYFWLPYFLGKSFDSVTANLVASLYSIGVMAGAILVGHVSDLLGCPTVVVGSSMTILMAFLSVLALQPESLSRDYLIGMLGCMGVLVGGANHTMKSSITANLGASHDPLLCHDKIAGTSNSIHRSVASMIASIGLLGIGPLQDAHGWGAVWVCLIVCSVEGIILLGPQIYRELTGKR